MKLVTNTDNVSEQSWTKFSRS